MLPQGLFHCSNASARVSGTGCTRSVAMLHRSLPVIQRMELDIARSIADTTDVDTGPLLSIYDMADFEMFLIEDQPT